MEEVVHIRDIQKAYTTVKALKGVTFSVPRGSVFGVLGPNGSGKTTLLGILLDVLKADQGSYEWVGYSEPHQARQQIGSLLETPNFYSYMSAADNLRISAKIKGRGEEQIDEVLKLVNLFERRDSRFSSFSLGMKQRLAIAAALLGKPDILVLDEPTNGLDPVGISEIRDLIRQLNHSGTTIIMASHLLDEVEKVCTHVAILRKGELLTTGSVLDVLNDEDRIELDAADRKALMSALSRNSSLKNLREDGVVQCSAVDGYTMNQINQYCFEQGIVLTHLVKKKRSLESKFMEITQS
ncbi:MAG: ATP-binding cassette domain-containing protein [Chitinophagaceae bacterium]|nr:ATP-binding cassette domain-containing protein [Chitinophagaceae bacterium]